MERVRTIGTLVVGLVFEYEVSVEALLLHLGQ